MTQLDITIRRRSHQNFAAVLAKRLPRVTEIVRTQREITEALLDYRERKRWMALADKAAHFAERMKAAPAKVEAAFDALLAEVDEMEAMATDSMARAHAVLQDTKTSVRTVVDIVNQMTNGTPSTT